jgi:4-amino-4-deoxy-L-arabinose transferase-like glycosyltransferase
MAFGFLLRAGLALWLDGDMGARGDEIAYLHEAKQFRETGVLETGILVRPPLFFILIAGIGMLFEPLGFDVRICLKIFQCLVGAATAIPVYLTAKRIGGIRVARLAVAFLMFDPTVVAYSHLVWPETVFLFVVAVIFHCVASLEQESTARPLGIGLLVGLALLIKPAFGLFTVVLAGHWLWRLGFRSTLRLVILVGGTAAVVISPWVIRNQIRYGPEVILVNQVPYNLWIGNSPTHPRKVNDWWRAMDTLQQSREGMRLGKKAITDDPGRFASNFVVRVLNLWGLEFHVMRHVMTQAYGKGVREHSLLVFWIIQGGWAIALLAAASGARTGSRDPTLRLLLIHALLFTAVVSVMVTTTRFRIPFAFPLAILSAVGVDRMLAGRLRRPDLIAAIVALGWLMLSFARPLFQAIASDKYGEVTTATRAAWQFFRY